MCIRDRDRYDKGFKLITLFGKDKNDLQWKINQYKDGSGSWKNIWLCKTLDDAKECLKKQCSDAMDINIEKDRSVQKYIDNMKEYEVEVPEEYLQYQEKFDHKELLSLLKQKREKVKELQEKVDELQLKADSSNLGEWEDFKGRVESIQWDKEKKKLDALEKKLKDLVSDEGKTAMAIKDIAALLA